MSRAVEFQAARAELARLGREIEATAALVRAHRAPVRQLDEALLRRDELTRRVRRFEEQR